MSDIQVMTIDPSTGICKMGAPKSPKLLTGMDKLIQIAALAFLKNPGRDVLNNTDGSGLRAMIGQYNLSALDEIRLVIIQKTKTIETEIISRQGTQVGLSTERLKKLSVLDVAADEINGIVMVRVQITNEAGDTRDIIV